MAHGLSVGSCESPDSSTNGDTMTTIQILVSVEISDDVTDDDVDTIVGNAVAQLTEPDFTGEGWDWRDPRTVRLVGSDWERAE
jgi:hypothetical protein